MAKQEKNALVREVSGIIFLFLSILIACSLFSYDPNDHPALTTSPKANNWIGVVGAYFGLLSYTFFGWSSNFMPLLSAYIGVSALFRKEFNVVRSGLWMLAFIALMSCVIQTFGGDEMWRISNRYPQGLGGILGYYVGGTIFWKYLKLGAMIIFLGGSMVALFMALQVKPLEVYELIAAYFNQRKSQKRQQALKSGDLKTVLRTREDEISERQRLIQRELDRRKKVVKGANGSKDAEDEELDKEGPVLSSASELKSKEKEKEKEVEDIAVQAPPPKPEYKINRPVKSKPPKQVIQPTIFGPYTLPSTEMLRLTTETGDGLDTKEEISKRGAIIETTLKDFGIDVRIGEITQGATITRFEVIPSPGVKVERIVNLQNNLSLALKAERVNILAPVAGKGTVGIEVANMTKTAVLIRELIESNEFQSSKAKIPLALGKDVYGKTLISDLADMPHLLIAGSTGAGKSVCINSIISSLLYRFGPEDLRLILIDPKVVELQIYNSLPHLVVPVVSDPKKVVVTLRWVIREMEKRYTIMAKVGVRNITAFNSKQKLAKKDPKPEPEPVSKPEEESDDNEQPMLLPEENIIVPNHLPFIVVVIDELADLMLTAPVDAEDAITRITQMARAAGIHLIVATQTPRADIVTGTIKTNLPAKIAFRVASKIDSRVILDENGAENLLGKGDMIYKSSDSSVLRRAQGAFISDDEVRSVVEHCAKQMPATYDMEMQEKLAKPVGETQEASDEDEELIEQCINVIRQEGRASTSLLQRRLRLGYTRAARIMDALEDRGIVGPPQGSKDREILMRMDGAPPENN